MTHAEYMKARAATRALAGLCDDCGGPTDNDTTRCDANGCRGKHNAKCRKYRDNHKGKVDHRKRVKSRRCRRLGICVDCCKPAVKRGQKTLARCEGCLERTAKQQRERRRRRGQRSELRHCSNCGASGHDVRTCEVRPEIALPNIADYATARRTWA